MSESQFTSGASTYTTTKARPTSAPHEFVITYRDLFVAVCVCCVHVGIESSSSAAVTAVLLYLVGASDVDVQ